MPDTITTPAGELKLGKLYQLSELGGVRYRTASGMTGWAIEAKHIGAPDAIDVTDCPPRQYVGRIEDVASTGAILVAKQAGRTPSGRQRWERSWTAPGYLLAAVPA